MFEYWSWKERAVVIGLAALVAVLVFLGLQREAELQRQIDALQLELRKAAAERAELLGRMLRAEWEEGRYCVLRLHVPADPGVWHMIGRGNVSGAGGYYAVIRLVDDEGSVVVPGVLRFATSDPEVWFRCNGGRAVAVLQTQFVADRKFSEFAVYAEGRLLLSRFPCDGLCGVEARLMRPVRPKYVDVLLAFYPPGVDGYSRIVYDYGYAVRIPVQ